MKNLLFLPAFLFMLTVHSQQTEDEIYIGKGKSAGNLIFQEAFNNGILSDAWKVNNGKWYVANLEEKGIKPPPGDNVYALASAGNAEIIIDIPVENMGSELQLSFTYWVHSKGSTGTVAVVLLNEKQDALSSIQFEPLPEKGGWEVFKSQFNVTKETALIRLKLGERSGNFGNTVYYKSLRVTRKR